MRTRTALLVALALAITLATVPSAAQQVPRTITAEQVEVGPPMGYGQILNEPGFEHGWEGWTWEGSALPDIHNPRSGVMNGLLCEDQGVISWIWQRFNIPDCQPGEPIYFLVCVDMFTNEGRPPGEDWMDVMEIWLADYQNLSHVQLRELWDVDDDGLPGYSCNWYVVNDMHEIGPDWTLYTACSTNAGDLSPTNYNVDDLEGYCMPRGWQPPAHRVFVPMVIR